MSYRRISCRLAAAAIAATLAAGCSREYYRNSADEEVYALLEVRGRSEVEDLSLGDRFRVEQEPLPVAARGSVGVAENFTEVPAPVAPVVPGESASPEAEPGPREAEAEGAGSAPAAEAEPVRSESEPDAAPPAPGDPAGPGEEVEGAGSTPGEEPEPDAAPLAPGDPAGPGEEAEGAGSTPGEESEPDAAPPAQPDREAVDPADRAQDAASPDPEASIPGVEWVSARILSLEDALALAFANNREYQSSREAIYLAALDLTLARHDFAPRFFGIIAGDFRHDSQGEDSGELTTRFGMNKLFANGARLSISLLNNFFQFFAGDRREVARTVAEAAVTQPLLRGFGRKIVEEPLVQAERDVVYQIRSFKRFRQVFAVRVVSEYYRILQERDRVINEYDNWRRLVRNRAEVEAFANAGRRARLEVDQARQQELQAEDGYSAAVQAYENALDDFKITLAIPIEEPIALDPKELDRLVERGVQPLEVSLEQALMGSTHLRLDLKTARGQLEDARRRTEVLADALRAQLDITADVSLPSGEGDGQKPLRFNTGNLEYGVGFTMDLPFDRKAERNSYVASVIAHEREKRELSLLEDTIRLTVRDAYRALEREIVSYPIQKASVELAEERVASTTLLRQAGTASTRDILESQSALLSTRNGLTRSLINYTIARLQFYRDVGALDVVDDSTLVEMDIGSKD